MLRLLSSLTALLALGACVNLDPAQAQVVRWLNPEPAVMAARPSGELFVDLRAVESASYLDERVAWRRDQVEYGFYDLVRWTEPPAEYLRRALVGELHVARGWTQRSNVKLVELEVQLVAFDEDWSSGKREARIRLQLRLHSNGRAAVQALEITEPIVADGPQALARAMQQALVRAAEQVADACRPAD